MGVLRDLIRSVGGRGFLFAVVAFLLTSAYAVWDGMPWEVWLDYNKWIGSAFFGAKAIEEAASKISGGKK
jgi:hypothetical protein